jgi:hypothetical protein
LALTINDGIHAKSVQEFIGMVSKRAQRGVQRFYRGVPKHFPKSQPSVFRSPRRIVNEKLLFNQLLAMNPSDFVGDTTTLDKLVRMQHHGLPTRLLDITSNPLMALYFACELREKDEDEEEGEVFILNVDNDDVKFPDSDRASVLANLARLTSPQREAIAHAAAECADLPLQQRIVEFNKAKSVLKLLHFIKQEKPYFEGLINSRHISGIIVVRAKLSNLRISAQAGAFLLFGDGAEFENSVKGQGILEKVIKVPANAKQRVRRELDHLGINESTVYPGLDRSAAYISKQFPVP